MNDVDTTVRSAAYLTARMIEEVLDDVSAALREELRTAHQRVAVSNGDDVLIRSDGLLDYVQNRADDQGVINTSEWISDYVDWQRVAEDAKQEMHGVQIGEHTYFAGKSRHLDPLCLEWPSAPAAATESPSP